MTEQFCVIGNPISHSLSPLIHNTWIKEHGFDAQYDMFAPEEHELGQLTDRVRNGHIKGMNVTVPFKQAIMPHLDALTADAREVGAVNTVYEKDGQAIGHNTDVYGFRKNLEETIPADKIKGNVVCLLGAGGAARAAAYALLHLEPNEIFVTNRSEERALALASHFSRIRVFNWNDRDIACEDAHLIVNTTSMGMVGHAPLELANDAITPGATVYDIVYNPRITPLLAQAQRCQARIVTGEGMLAHQAAAAFKIWFGVLPNTDAAKHHILRSGV